MAEEAPSTSVICPKCGTPMFETCTYCEQTRKNPSGTRKAANWAYIVQYTREKSA